MTPNPIIQIMSLYVLTHFGRRVTFEFATYVACLLGGQCFSSEIKGMGLTEQELWGPMATQRY